MVLMVLLNRQQALQEEQQIQEWVQWLKLTKKILLLCMQATLLMLKMGFKKEKINMILPKKKKQLFLNFSYLSLPKELMQEQQKIFKVSQIKALKDKEKSLIKDK